MHIIYEIIGSILIGGVVLIMLFQFNATVMEGAAVQTFTTMVQSNITAMADLLEYDFRKIGYRVGAAPDSAIIYADSNRIVFKGDFDNNGSIDRLEYYLSKTTASAHVNPDARVLRRVHSVTGSQSIDLGITRFRLAYFDKNNVFMPGDPVMNPSRIGSIAIAMDVESTSPYDTTFQGGNWERTITPKNLK